MDASYRAFSFAAACLAALLSPASASAQTFTLLADSSITSPLGGPFSMVAPAVSGNAVLFQSTVTGVAGSNNGLFKGVPTSYQTLSKVDDTVAGTTYTITNFSSTLGLPTYAPVFDATGRGACGIYCTGGGGLASWDGQTMEGAILPGAGVPIPGGAATFANTGLPAISNGLIAFTGGNTGAGELGAYTSGTAAITRIADKNSAIPNGTGNFTNFYTRCSIHDGTVAFVALGQRRAGGRLHGRRRSLGARGGHRARRCRVERATSSAFWRPVITSSVVSFVGVWGASQSGIYTTIGGALTKVVDSQTSYPGTAGGNYSFLFFDQPPTAQLAGSGGRLAFFARSTGTPTQAVFVWDASGITKLVESGANFDGAYVYYPDMGPQAVDGNKVGFKVTTQTGGGYRNFLATFPASTAAQDWGLYE